MTHGSLYSGIGGWLLAARWAGIDNIFTCEIDKFCNKVLDKHFPNTDRHHDIKEADFKKYRGTIDIISTSDPCQPFSFAGKRGGKADDRYLWPETIRVIREIKPSYVVFENVPGFISLGFETVASDLEAEGYTVESFIIPACAVGAWHRRDRLWIICYTTKQGFQDGGGPPMGEYEGTEQELKRSYSIHRELQNVSDTEVQGLEGENTKGGTCPDGWNMQQPWSDWWTTEPNVGRVAHGIPSRVDRLKSLGNSIVPQIAYIIFEAIKKNPQNIWKSQK
jgi:DNA (cytosine-5)-methyltransferase 1